MLCKTFNTHLNLKGRPGWGQASAPPALLPWEDGPRTGWGRRCPHHPPWQQPQALALNHITSYPWLNSQLQGASATQIWDHCWVLTRLKLSTQRAGLLENHSSNIRLDIECKGANTMQECNCFGRQRLQTSVSYGIAGPLKNRSTYYLTETMLEYNRRIKPR